MKRTLLLAGVGLLLSCAVKAQNDVVEFLKGGKADAGTLSQAYLQPFAYAIGDGLNTGWYNTAATHKLGGFDFTFSVSAVQVPGSAATFDVSRLGLSRMAVTSGGNRASTIAGSSSGIRPQMQVTDEQGHAVGSFNMPNGTGIDRVSLPMIQLGVGILPGTDLVVRYVPNLNFNFDGGDAGVGLWGLGLKHNFKDWIPGLKKLPFDASLFGAYSALSGQSVFNYQSSGLEGENLSISFANDGNQQLKLEATTLKYGLIVSKKLGVLTLFGGIGQNTSELTGYLVGKYTVTAEVEEGGATYTSKEDLIDPVSVKYKTSNMSLDAGLRLKLGVFGLSASASKAEYVSYSFSLGFSYK